MQLQYNFSIDKHPSWLGKMPGTIMMKKVTYRSKKACWTIMLCKVAVKKWILLKSEG